MRRSHSEALAGGREAAAFTLIELLVVIGVIAVLLGLTFPVFSRARESAKRANCAANLRNLAAACAAFAADHDGAYPMAYHVPDPNPKNIWAFPLLISYNPNLEDAAGSWKTYGTPWSTFEKYGTSGDTFHCPSGEGVRYLFPEDLPGMNPVWGRVAWTDYLYVGGLTSTNCRPDLNSSAAKSVPHWGSFVPSVSPRDSDAPHRILAADTVYWSGGSSYEWDKKGMRAYRINHPQTGNYKMPDYQNILYGDGHVEGKGREYYSAALSTSATSGNYCLKQAQDPTGGFMYWGEVPPPPPSPPSPPSPPKPPVPPPPPAPPKPPTPPGPPPIIPPDPIPA